MKHRKAEKSEIKLNMTSMLDIVFQLIIFFILVTNFAAADLPPLEPPDPLESKARELETAFKRTINIVPELRVVGTNDRGRSIEEATGLAQRVQLADKHYAVDQASMKALTQELKDVQAMRPDQKLEIDLRVDKRLQFDQVQPVMIAITGAGIARVNLVALVDVRQQN